MGNKLTTKKRELDFGDILEEFFNTALTEKSFSTKKKGFVTDIIELDDKYVLDIQAPGMSKDDISIEVNDGVLKVSGKKEMRNEVKKENYILVESQVGEFERSFKLPDDVDAEKIEAKTENGVIELVIPKSENNSNVKKIEIK